VFSKVEVEKELEDLPNTQAHVEAIIEAQQKTGTPLNTQSLDRALALANDLPGLSVQGSLRQGREAGETELLLKLYQGRTRQAELTVDNAGSRATGFMRVMASLTWFNPNDLADMLNVVAVHTRGSDYARLAYSLPVGTDVTQGMDWINSMLRADNLSATVTLAADAKKFQKTSAQGLLVSGYKAQVMSAQVAGFYRDFSPGGGTGTYSAQLKNGHIYSW
jgi:hemolysin activation/secretion protein